MPTKREREYYQMGFRDGFNVAQGGSAVGVASHQIPSLLEPEYGPQGGRLTYTDITKKPKRKLSAWNKFVKQNSSKPRFRYARSGKLNLKKMAVAFRKTPAGRKKRR